VVMMICALDQTYEPGDCRNHCRFFQLGYDLSAGVLKIQTFSSLVSILSLLNKLDRETTLESRNFLTG